MRSQVLEMCIGLGIYELVLAIVCVCLFCERNVFWGLFAGMIAAILYLVHMGYSVQRCIQCADPDHAEKLMRGYVGQRMAGILVFALVLTTVTEFNLVAAMAAILGVKAGAYFYPAVHKIKNYAVGRRVEIRD